MKVNILSDIHIEFNRKFKFNKNETYLVAGDIGHIDNSIPFLSKLDKSTKVIFIAGNHEFYNNSIEGYETLKLEFKDSENITFLQDNYITLNGVNIYGTTLWSSLDSSLDTNTLYKHGKDGMNDFKFIKYKNALLDPSDLVDFYNDALSKMTSFLQEKKNEKTIIMTHNSPSHSSNLSKYRTSLLNPFFCNKMDDYILEHKPNVWIHGHLHNTTLYKIGDTRIICNPLGYPYENMNKRDITIDLNNFDITNK
jgi:predicted phosphodiesterase